MLQISNRYKRNFAENIFMESLISIRLILIIILAQNQALLLKNWGFLGDFK